MPALRRVPVGQLGLHEMWPVSRVSDSLRAEVTCPHCGKRQSDVIDSRGTKQHGIWRRRECHFCGKRFSTQEYVVMKPEQPRIG